MHQLTENDTMRAAIFTRTQSVTAAVVDQANKEPLFHPSAVASETGTGGRSGTKKKRTRTVSKAKVTSPQHLRKYGVPNY